MDQTRRTVMRPSRRAGRETEAAREAFRRMPEADRKTLIRRCQRIPVV